MRKLFGLAFLFALVLLPRQAHATISTVQTDVRNEACVSGTTCAVTVSACGTSKHFAILFAFSASTSISLNSVSGCGGTWVVEAPCSLSNATVGGVVGCAYNLGLSSAGTTITATWSATNSNQAWLSYYEASYTGSSVSFDNAGSVNDSVASTSLAGVGLTLTGSNDAIFQLLVQVSGSANSINGSYTIGSNDAFGATARLYNSATGTAPTWSWNASTQALAAAIAIAETSAVVLPASKMAGPSKIAGPAKID